MKRLTKKDYKLSMKLIDKYFDAEPSTLEGVILQLLAMLVIKYEKQ